jgi:hypothetical protein
MRQRLAAGQGQIGHLEIAGADRGFDLGRPEPLRTIFDPSPPPCEAVGSWEPWRNDPPARCPDKPCDLV